MVQVHCPIDCGNAPRKQVLRDLNIAFAQGDVDAVLDMVRDNIVWNIVGERRIEGIDEMRSALNAMKEVEAKELHIHHIITHGSEAALHGTITMADGSRWAFCDVYVFAGFSKTAKLKEITSYGADVS